MMKYAHISWDGTIMKNPSETVDTLGFPVYLLAPVAVWVSVAVPFKAPLVFKS